MTRIDQIGLPDVSDLKHSRREKTGSYQGDNQEDDWVSPDKFAQTPENVFEEWIQYVMDTKHFDLFSHTPHKILFQ